MKRTSCIILLIFTIQLAFAQKTTQKSYALYGKSPTENITIHQQNTIESIDDGIFSIENLDQNFEGELIEFFVTKSSKTKFKKNTIEKTYISDRTNFAATILGNTMKSADSSYLEGKTIIYSKEAYDLWNVSNFDEYKSYEQDELNDELVSMNDTVTKIHTYFRYPEKMYIGEQLELNKDNIGYFYEIEDYESVNGTLKLKEVVTRENDSIAIFDVKIQIKGLVNPEGNAYILIEMNGTVERSLTHFYDREANLVGTVKMEGKLKEDQYLTMFVPATLVMKQTLN